MTFQGNLYLHQPFIFRTLLFTVGYRTIFSALSVRVLMCMHASYKFWLHLETGVFPELSSIYFLGLEDCFDLIDMFARTT